MFISVTSHLETSFTYLALITLNSMDSHTHRIVYLCMALRSVSVLYRTQSLGNMVQVKFQVNACT